MRNCGDASSSGQMPEGESHRWGPQPHPRSGGDTVSHILAVIKHRCVILFPFADDDDPVHIHGLEDDPHRIDRGTDLRLPLSPRPIKRAAASAPASVTRASSRARFRVGSLPTGSIRPPWLVIVSQYEKVDDEIAERRAPDPRIDPVEKSAMTRKDIARILESSLALEHTFAQVTERGERADHQARAIRPAAA